MPRSRRERPQRYVVAVPPPGEQVTDEHILLKRVLARLRMTSIEIGRFSKWSRVNMAIRAVPLNGRPRTLPRSFIVALRACKAEARSPKRAEAYREKLREAAMVRGAEGTDTVYQQLHDLTAHHGAGELESLLALGYCQALGANYVSKELLRPLAVAIVQASRPTPVTFVPPTGEMRAFGKWFDRIRKTVTRMRERIGARAVGARAEAAIDHMDAHLRRQSP